MYVVFCVFIPFYTTCTVPGSHCRRGLLTVVTTHTLQYTVLYYEPRPSHRRSICMLFCPLSLFLHRQQVFTAIIDSALFLHILHLCLALAPNDQIHFFKHISSISAASSIIAVVDLRLALSTRHH